MSAFAKHREKLCEAGRSLFERGHTHGSTGNISARMEDGSILISPTGASLGRLDPGQLSVIDIEGRLVDGPQPTKEVPLHAGFYRKRGTRAGAVVHLHSTHSVAVSMLADTDPHRAIAPLTPYSVMQLGKVKLLPYFMPGDAAMGEAVAAVAARHHAVLLANHGPVVAGTDLGSACAAIEELEASARLMLVTHGMTVRPLSDRQIADLVGKFGIDWPEEP